MQMQHVPLMQISSFVNNPTFKPLSPPSPPPPPLIPLPPLPLHIPQFLLDFPHHPLIPRILPHIIADFDSRVAVRGGELDDDVEGRGF